MADIDRRIIADLRRSLGKKMGRVELRIDRLVETNRKYRKAISELQVRVARLDGNVDPEDLDQ